MKISNMSSRHICNQYNSYVIMGSCNCGKNEF